MWPQLESLEGLPRGLRVLGLGVMKRTGIDSPYKELEEKWGDGWEELKRVELWYPEKVERVEKHFQRGSCAVEVVPFHPYRFTC